VDAGVGQPTAGDGGRPATDAGATPGGADAGGSSGDADRCSVVRTGGTGNEPGGSIPVCCATPASDKPLVDEVFRLLNEYRAANGRTALTFDPALGAAIQAHCEHMVAHPFFSHTAPEASLATFPMRSQACGVASNGENLASGQRAPAEVMMGWIASPDHNTNMLNALWRRVGIGYHRGMWGQLFGR
jgi:uncharacterized protein YkwD